MVLVLVPVLNVFSMIDDLFISETYILMNVGCDFVQRDLFTVLFLQDIQRYRKHSSKNGYINPIVHHNLMNRLRKNVGVC